MKSAEFLLHMLKVTILSSFDLKIVIMNFKRQSSCKNLNSSIIPPCQNAESNAEYKGLDADHLIIEHIQVFVMGNFFINDGQETVT